MNSLQAEMHTGIAGIDGARDALAELDSLARFPLTLRASYARMIALRGEVEPYVALVRGPGARDVVAGALLLRTEAPCGILFSGVRFAPRDDTDFPARHLPAAEALAVGIAAELERLESPWELDIGGIDVGDPVAAMLAGRLPGGRLETEDGLRRLSLDRTRTTAAHLSRAFRTEMHRGRRAGDRRGVAVRMSTSTAPAAILASLDEWWPLARSRSDAGRARRALLEAMAMRGLVESTTLEIDGHFAAYSLAARLTAEYRILDAAAAPAWDELYPGHHVAARMIGLARAEPAFRTVSWLPCSDNGTVVAGEPAECWRLRAGPLATRGSSAAG